MSRVAEHYRDLISDVYSWMLGGFDAAIDRNMAFFEKHGVRPCASGRAVDLGAGCGFQAIPLAQAGFSVTAIDLDRSLLDELEQHAKDARIRTLAGDLMDFGDHIDGPVELAVCMTDTLLHLESTDQIRELCRRVKLALEPGGRFIATFRDLSTPLIELDRFIPVRSDASRILTCFLEDEGDRVKVHDLLYERVDETWQFAKSYYLKLRVGPESARAWLLAAGFDEVRMSVDNGLVTVDAVSG
jgi:2-polyprenyl-3-methyl-5-hydroxy-6-metoxy-1,4-benzoquinol methylase